MQMYTRRPLVEWRAMKGGGHRPSGELANLVLQKLPLFGSRYPGLLDGLQVVKQRPAVAAGIKQFLLGPYELSHQVSSACWIASEFGPSAVHLVVFALAFWRCMCSDRVGVLRSACVVAVP